MPEIGVRDIKGNVTGTLSLPDELFGVEGRDALMHEAVLNYLANQRQGTHATKSKGLVSGGGKKPWKQKHTGRARAGSNRSPLWRGGGTVFGPQPRDYSYSIPRQARRLALYAAVSGKIASGELVVVDSLKLDAPKTRAMAEIISSLGLAGGSLLIVDGQTDRTALLSTGNIPGVCYKAARDLHAYDVLSHDRVMMTASAVEALKGPESGGKQ
jgi:large subunit ribosomal protein L4